MKKLLRRAGVLALAVVHDKQVDRAGKALAVIVAVRVLIAMGASAEVIHIVQQLGG